MDESMAHTVTIKTQEVHKVPLHAWRPIGRRLSALLTGRSSSTLQGLMVHIGVIDVDYTGQICTLVSMATPPVTTGKGTLNLCLFWVLFLQLSKLFVGTVDLVQVESHLFFGLKQCQKNGHKWFVHS